MRLVKDNDPDKDDIFWAPRDADVTVFYVIDRDGYYMATAATKALLDDKIGRKVVAADLRELRRQIRATRATRQNPYRMP